MLLDFEVSWSPVSCMGLHAAHVNGNHAKGKATANWAGCQGVFKLLGCCML